MEPEKEQNAKVRKSQPLPSPRSTERPLIPQTAPNARKRGFPRVLILDRYIFREFMLAFFAVLSFCALLLLVASIFEKFQEMMENETPLDKAVLYFACSLPFKMVQVLPMASLLAVLFSVGSLARNNEILALMTSGVHSLRIAAPVLFGGVLIFLGMLLTNEVLVAPLEQRARYLERRYIDAKDEAKIVTQKDVFARGLDNRFYLMKMYESREMKMYAPQIVDMTDDYSGVKQRIEAKSATLVANMPEERKSEWILSHPRIWSFDEKGSLRSFQKFDNDVTVYFEPDLSTILSQKKKPEEMNYFELRRHIDILSQRDQPVHEYVTDLLRKISFPLGVLIIMVIAFSYAARTRAGTVMSAFGYGILWAVGYYALNALITALGHSGSVNPYIAAWLPNFVFLFVAVHHLKKSYRWYA